LALAFEASAALAFREAEMTRIKGLEYKWLVGIVYIMALFMDLLDMSVTNVAIPTLATDFKASTTTIEWVITGYLLSLAMFIPVSGWLGDKFGTKRTFVGALSIFVAGSLLCGFAWDVESLIAFRVLQGVGGGMLTPVGMTMLFRAFPPSERAKASAILTIPVAVAPALGPIVGGYLVDYASWRWIFLINIPIGAIALIIAALILREEKQEQAGSLDVMGFVLSGAGLVAVVYALGQAGHAGFGDQQVLLFGIGGLVLLTAFVLWELRVAEPMVDVRLLTNKLFGVSNVVVITANASRMGSFFLLPLLLQTQKGLSAFDVGLLTFPMALGVAAMSKPAASLYESLGPRRLMAVGLAGNAVMTLLLALINYDTSNWIIAANMFVRGMFMAFIFVPMQAVAFATISPESMGRASSILSVTRQVAASLGVAIMATALTNRLGFHDATLGLEATRDGALIAFQDTFVFAGLLGILGIIAALFIDDRAVAAASHAEHEMAGEHAPPMRHAVEHYTD
jgi:EmrB/QacA subfamily drug resistance transporter